MKQRDNSNEVVNSYVYHFQQAQANFFQLIREERLRRRMLKSRQKGIRVYD